MEPVEPTLPVFNNTPDVVPEKAVDGKEEATLPKSTVDEALGGGKFGAILQSKQSYLPVDEYRDYMNNVRLDTDINTLRADNQSAGEKWLHFGGQFLGEIVGGTVSAFGSLPEIADTVVTELRGGDADFNNWMMQFGEDIIQASKQAAPIHERNPGASWQTNDLGWWLNRGVSVASGLSMLIPGRAVTSALGWFGKALAAIGKGMRVESKLGQALRLAETMTMRQKELVKMFATASTMRNAENMRESLSVVQNAKAKSLEIFQNDDAYNDVLSSEVGQEYLAEGRVPTKEGLANYIAAKAGHRAYLINSANIVFDLFQAGALMKTNYFTRGKAPIAVRIKEAIEAGKPLSKAAIIGGTIEPYLVGTLHSLSEGVEEGVNFVGTAEAEKQVRVNLGQSSEKLGVLENVKEYLADKNMWESAFFGTIGGAVFEGTAHLMQLAGDGEGKADTHAKLGEIQNRYATLKAFNGKVTELISKADKSEAGQEILKAQLTNEKNKLIYSLAANAAATGNVDLLLNTIENGEFQKSMINNMSDNDIKMLGIDSVGKEVSKMKSRVLEIERYYNDAVNKFSTKKVLGATKQAAIRDYTLYNYLNSIFKEHSESMRDIIRSYTDKDASYAEAFAHGIPADTVLELETLAKIKASGKYEQYNDLITKRMESLRALIPDAELPTLTGVNKKALEPFLVEKVIHDIGALDMQNNLSELLKDKFLEKSDRLMANQVEAKKKEIEDREYAQFSEAVKASIAPMPLAEKVATLEAELAKQTSDRHKNFLRREITHYKGQLENQRLSAPLASNKAPNENAQPAAAANPVPEVDMATALLKEFGEDQDAVDNALNKLDSILDSTGTEASKIDKLEKAIRKYGPNMPIISQLYQDSLDNLKDNAVVNSRTKEGNVSVGQEYDYNGRHIKVLKIYDDGHGQTWVALHVSYQGNTDTVVRKIGWMTNATPIVEEVQVQKLTVGNLLRQFPNSVYLTNEVLAAVDLDTTVVIDENKVLKPNQLAAYDPTTHTILLNNSLANGADLNLPEDFDEVLAHEIVHVTINREMPNGTPERLAFDQTLEVAKQLLKLPDESRGSVQQERFDLLKVSPAEELVTYLITDVATRNLFRDEANANALRNVQQAVQNSPVLSSALAYQLGLQIPNRDISVVPASVVFYTATANAEELAAQYFINLNEVTGTGKDGKITLTDVRNFIKKNKVKSLRELREVTEATSNVVAGHAQTNIYLPFINHGIINGVVDAKAYNDFVTKNFPDNPLTVTQDELEAAIKEILSPAINAGQNVAGENVGGTFLSVRYIGKNTFGLFTTNNNVLVGVLNNPEVTQKTLDYVNSLLEITDPSKIETTGLKPGQLKLAKWRIDELTQETPTNKPMYLEAARLQDAIAAETAIRTTAQAALAADSNAGIYVRVARKTSGNFAHNEDGKTMPVNEAFPDINNLWFRSPNDPFPNLYSSNSGEVFQRNEERATDYYNHDLNYNQGVPFMLVPGANSYGDQINTMIPVPLQMVEATPVIANKATTIIAKAIKTARRLIEAGEIDNLYNHPEMTALRKEMEAFFAVETGKELKNYVKFDKTGIRFNFMDNGEEKHVHIVYSQRPSKQTVLYVAKEKERPDRYTAATAYDVDTATTSGARQLSLTGKTKDTKRFREFLEQAFQKKTVHIDFNRKNSDAEFEDGKTYVQWMLASGVIHTDMVPLTRPDGSLMRDERGNMLPNITNKYDNKVRNSNLIIAVDNRVSVSSSSADAVGISAPVRESMPEVAEEAAKVVDTIGSNVAKALTDVNKEMVTKAVEALLKDGTVTIDYDGDIIAFTTALQTSIPGDYVVDYKQAGNSVQLKLIRVTQQLSLTEKKSKSGPGEQGALFREVAQGDESLERVNPEQVEAWWNKTFGGNVPLDWQTVGMINAYGRQAWGIFENAMVKLTYAAPRGTEYHEALHVALWLYTDAKNRDAILQEARNKYGNLGDVALEEILAEEFMDYMLKQGETDQVAPKAKGLFSRLLNWIRNWFSKYKRGESKTERLFKDIRNGELAKLPDVSLVAAAKAVSRLRIVEGLTGAQELESIQLLAKKLIELHDTHNFKDLLQYGQENNIAEIVRVNLLQERVNLDTVSVANLDRITRPETFNSLWNKTLLYVRRQFGLTLNEALDFNQNEELSRNWDDSVMTDSQRDNVNIRIKRLIMTTPSNTPGAFLGLETYLDFNKVYPYLQRNMIGALDMDEMLSRLRTMAEFDSTMLNIANRLEADPSLQRAWYSNFRKQLPNRDVILIDADAISIDKSNKAASHYILTDVWSNTLEVRLEQEYFTPEVKKEMNIAMLAVNRNLQNNNIEEAVNSTVKVFNHLGIEITADNLHKLVRLPHIVEQYGSVQNVFANVVVPVFKVIEAEIAKYKPGTPARFDSYGSYNKLAAVAMLFQYDLMENSSMDVNGNNVFSVINPNFLSMFMERFNAVKTDNSTYVNKEEAKAALLELLKQYGADPANNFSNWLWAVDGVNGMLKLVDGKIDINNATVEHLNLDFIDRFGYTMFDGIKNTATGNSGQYKTMPDNDWLFTQLAMFFGGFNSSKNDSNTRSVKIAIPIPSDGGVMYFIESAKFTGATAKGTVPRDSNLFRAIENLAYQDLYRAIAARDLLFDYDTTTFTYTIKDGLDYTKLQKGYHYNGLDANGKPMLLKNGKPTGNVFRSYNIPETAGIGYRNGVPIHDVVGSAEQLAIEQQISNAVDKYIVEKVKQGIEYIDKYRDVLPSIKEYAAQYTGRFNQFVAEFVLNAKISNVEQMNFFIGTEAEYKMDKTGDTIILDPNKRAKEIVSPGVTLLSLSKKTFSAATITDIELRTPIFNSIANVVAAKLKEEQKKFRGMRIDVKKLMSKETPTFNELEAAVYSIVNGYLNTNIGDAQGYITIDRYEQIMLGLGRLTPQYANIIDKIRKGGRLNVDELTLALQPIKGFYYGRTFDPYLNKMVSTQIKYSTLPLIPQFVVGTQMENMYTWMKDNTLDEVFFESAQKVGQTNPITITDENGNIIPEKLQEYSRRNGYEFANYENANWRLQVDTPDHLIDDENKLGTQIAKIIVANLSPTVTYNYNGKSAKATELVHDYMQTMVQNIQESADDLLEEMGVSLVNDEYVVSDIQKVQNVLMREIEQRNIAENYADAVQLVEDDNGKMKFKLPLFLNIMANKWESILSSLFTNNVINQKQPGGSLAMFSSAFITNKLAKPQTMSDEEYFLMTDVVGDSSTGIDWLESKHKSGNLRLAPPEVRKDGTIIAEALLPRWSKNLFTVNENGDSVPIPIDKIAAEAPELLEHIWYRIPYEKKGSSLVVKVVGFLPNDQGNILVLPQEAITMSGEDNDFDKRYGMYPEFWKDSEDTFHRYRWYDDTSDAAFEQWLTDKRTKTLLRELKANPTEAMKRARTQIKRFITSKQNIVATNKIIHAAQKGETETILNTYREALNIEEGADLTIYDMKDIVKERIAYIVSELDDVNEVIQSQYWPQRQFDELVDYQTTLISAIRGARHIANEINYSIRQFAELWGTAGKAAKARKQELIDKYVARENLALRDALRTEFEALPVEKRNPRAARNNRILDIMSAILTNPAHYKEMMQPSGFADAKAVIAELNAIPRADRSGILHTPLTSFTDFHTQIALRKKNVDGIALKGMATDANSFLAVMQIARMELRPDLGIVMKYNLDEYNEKDLQRMFGDNNVTVVPGTKAKTTGENFDTVINNEQPTTTESKPGYAYVRHTRFAWNVDGSYLNVDGQMLTEPITQVLALTLDIVKEGMIPNVNTYTFHILAALLGTGVSIRNAAMLLNQPFLTDLSKYYFDNQSVLAQPTGSEISELKSQYAAKLFRVRDRLGRYSTNDKTYWGLSKGAEEGRLFMKQANVKTYLGYTIPTDHAGADGNIAFTAEELKAMIDYAQNDFISDSTSSDKAKLRKAEKYLTNQLLIAEKFLKYKEAGEAYNDILNAMSVDRRAVGPSIANTLKLEDAIYHATHYETIKRIDNAVGKYAETGKYTVTGMPELRELAGNTVSNASDKKSHVFVGEGARIFVKDAASGKKIPATEAVYGENSAYPVMKAYRTYGNDLGFRVLSPMFLKYAPAFRNFANQIQSYLGNRFSDDIYNRATAFAQVAVLRDLPFLAAVNQTTLLGVDKPKITLPGNVTIEEFRTLSTANKLLIVKEMLKDELQHQSHILNYLNPKLAQRDIRRVGYHSIDFVNSMTDTIIDDHLVSSFQEMWDSGNEFVADLARDLVKYSYYTNGFTMKRNSFSKLIPTDVFASTEVNIDGYLQEVMKLSQDPTWLTINKFGGDLTLLQRFLMANYDDAKLVPKLNLFDNKVASVWKLNPVTGILSINSKIHSTQGRNLSKASYISVPVIRTNREGDRIKVGETLYVLAKMVGDTLYFIPQPKLGNRYTVETGTTSIVPGNNPMFTTETYLSLIDSGGFGKNILNKQFAKQEDTLDAYGILWERATKHIGDIVTPTHSSKVTPKVFSNLFGEYSNQNEYFKEDLVMVTAQSLYGMQDKDNAAITIRDAMFTKNQAGHFRLTGVYANVYTALSAGANIAIPSPVDSNGNSIINKEFHIGVFLLTKHLDGLADAGRLDKRVSNGIAYYATEGNLHTIDNHKC